MFTGEVQRNSSKSVIIASTLSNLFRWDSTMLFIQLSGVYTAGGYSSLFPKKKKAIKERPVNHWWCRRLFLFFAFQHNSMGGRNWRGCCWNRGLHSQHFLISHFIVAQWPHYSSLDSDVLVKLIQLIQNPLKGGTFAMLIKLAWSRVYSAISTTKLHFPSCHDSQNHLYICLYYHLREKILTSV